MMWMSLAKIKRGWIIIVCMTLFLGITVSSQAFLEVNNLPTVSNLNSIPDSGNGNLKEGEHINRAVSHLIVTFSQAMHNPAGDDDENDVTNPENYIMVIQASEGGIHSVRCNELNLDDEQIPIESVEYDAEKYEATLILNSGTPLPDNVYRILVCGSTGLQDESGNPLDGDNDGEGGDDFILDFEVDTTSPIVVSVDIGEEERIEDNTVLDHATVTTEIHLNYSDPLFNAAGHTEPHDITNKANFQMIEAGPNGVLDTGVCDPLTSDDIAVQITDLKYNTPHEFSTLTLNDENPLPSGTYRVSVCNNVYNLAGDFMDYPEGGSSKIFIVPTQTDFEGPTVTQIDMADSLDVQEGDTVGVISPIEISFSEELQTYPSAHESSPWNEDNYSLKSAGPNGTLETAPCGDTLLGDDIEIDILGIGYSSTNAQTTLTISNANELQPGNYTVSVCGRKTLHDLQGNFLNDGAFNTNLNFILVSPDTTGPTALQIDLGSTTDVSDGDSVYNITNATIHFSEAMNDPAGDAEELDVTYAENYALKEAGPNGILDTAPCSDIPKEDDSAIPIESVSYDNNSYQATVTFENGILLAEGKYTLAICGRKTLQDLAGNFFNDGVSNDALSFVVLAPDTEGPYVEAASFGGKANVSNGDIVDTHHLLWIHFNEPMLNPVGDTEEGDVTNPENYALKEAGPNGVLDTAPCGNTLLGDDIAIDIDAVTYSTQSMTADLAVNGYINLPVGNYTLAVCGRKTLTDLAGNFFNNGVSNYALSYVIEQPDDTGPTVTAVDLDGQDDVQDGAQVNEVTTITIHFDEAMYNPNGHSHTNDVTNPNNYALVGSGNNDNLNTVLCESVKADDVGVAIDSISYDEATFTAVLHINGNVSLPTDLYQVGVCGRTTLRDIEGNFLNDGASDFGLKFEVIEEDVTGPSIDSIDIGDLGDVSSGDSVTPINSLTVKFSEQMFNPSGSSNPNDVTNPANYALISSGPNGSIDTPVCESPQSDDTAVVIDSVAYNDTTFEATIYFNGGDKLPENGYQFTICGEGTLQDESGNFFNNGEGDFSLLFTVSEMSSSNFIIFIPIVHR